MNPASGQDGAAGQDRDVHLEATAAGSARIFQAGGDQNFHYHGRTRPYLIGDLVASAPPDTEWLLEQPSRLLGARSQVVPFVGRQTELRRLGEWRDADGHLSVLLLHGPGGQGKTRLACEFAERSRDRRWQVLQAGTLPTHRGEPSVPEVDTVGVLLVVDYADRWALSELERLLSDPALQQERPTRVLLIGRTVRWFAGLRGVLADLRAGAGDLLLTPLGEDRPAMFRAARDRFADLYGLQDASAVSAPAVLPDHPDYGLTLTVQMAALVAVDAFRRGAEAPTSPHELSAYLLDREYQVWQRLFEAGAHGQDFQTRPAVMARAVFTAALTGAVDQDCGSRAIRRLDLPGHPQDLLVDHRFCYPPSDRELVLEPLYPDRLAEDFIALLTPGHDISAYDPDPWAKNVPATLLTEGKDLRPVVVGRAMLFLTSAAERWPHLRGKVLYPLLRSDPALALEAGSATLSSLASIDDLPDEILAAVKQLLPPGRHVDLDIGAAAIDLAWASRTLPQTEDLDDEARLRLALSNRLAAAGRTGEALEQSGLAVEVGRRLVAADRFGARSLLAGALSNHADDLAAVGRHDDALRYAEEVLEFLPNPNSPDFVVRTMEDAAEGALYGTRFWGEDLAEAMNNLALRLDQVGRRADAMAASREAVALYEGLSRAGIGRDDAGWANALDNHAARLRQAGKAEEALTLSSQSVELRTALAESDRARYLPELATSINNYAIKLAEVGRHAEALEQSERAVALRGELASANRGVYLPDLASATTHHAMRLLHAGLHAEAMTAAGQAVKQYEELTATAPAAHLPRLALALTNYSTCLIEVGRTAEALVCIERAVTLFEDFSPGDRAANLHAFAGTLANHAALLDRLGRPIEAVTWSERAVRMREELAVDAPGPAPLLALSDTLFKHVHHLSQVGRFAEAISHSEHAVALQEELADAPDPQQLQKFAGLLHNYAVSLAESGRPAEALAASERALAIRKRLSETATNAQVAESLTLHAVRLAEAGEHREALAESDRAVRMYEELAEADPVTHTPALAVALTNHGNRLAAAERHDDALARTRRACALFEALAGQDRPKYLNQLAVAFKNLVARLVQVGDHPAACPPAERTVELYRELVDDYGSVHLAALVRQLGILASLRLATGDPGSKVPLSTLRSGTAVFDLTRPLRDERQIRSARRAIARLSPLTDGPRGARTQGQAELGLFLLVMNNSPLATADYEEMLTHAQEAVDAFRRAGDTVGARLALGATVIALIGRSDRPGAETAMARLEVLDPDYARWWRSYTEAMLTTDLDQQVNGLRRCVQAAHVLGEFADYYTIMCMEKLDQLVGKAGPAVHHSTVVAATVRERTSEE
ncbi:tetratricopeptide repeat protein [Spirillospora sp. NPDC048824]|uniref:tetratricopeptide repeat protein n=1 Tax=Spirillospora sp. NPDC048824 TaxID=3364526 RepID=UPI00371A1D6E